MAVISTIVPIGSGVTSSGDIVVSGGEFEVSGGGAIVGTIIADGGSTLISAGGTATDTTVQEDFTESFYPFPNTLDPFPNITSLLGEQAVLGGIAVSTLVGNGGIELVGSGGGEIGETSGALVLNGGLEVIGGGVIYFPSLGPGLAEGMTIDGGEAVISSGGSALGTSVTNGLLIVAAGGTDSGASVGNRGTVEVFGGTDSGTTVNNGGVLEVRSGGTANSVTVDSGGSLFDSNTGEYGVIISGGVVSALTIHDPNDPYVTAQAYIGSGGTLDGNTKIDGGELILIDGAVVQPNAKVTMVHTGELLLDADTFQGTIRDFGGQDFIDLRSIGFVGHGPNATTATFTQTDAHGGMLQIAQGSNEVDLRLAGTYTTANFDLGRDGFHGTYVFFVHT